ncbi:GntR family transcriptional regulator [Kocuria rhizophila]|nr:GntR family transcriptional regulator [Kocuria rhizophila]
MSTAPAYTVVLDWLEQQLRSGGLRVGDKPPAERALAEDFGISRASVREAVRTLAAMGLVRTATGSGHRTPRHCHPDPSAALGWALRMHRHPLLPAADVVSTPDPAGDAVEPARGVVGDRRTTGVLAEAEQMLDRMEDRAGDEEFHALQRPAPPAPASPGGNVVLETIMASLRGGRGRLRPGDRGGHVPTGRAVCGGAAAERRRAIHRAARAGTGRRAGTAAA